MGGEGRFAPAIMGTPGERWRPARSGDEARTDARAYGIALVSRLPVVRWSVTRLPSAPVRSPVLMPGPTRKVIWLRDEPRVLLTAIVQTASGPMTVATTHLSFVPGWNGAQLRRVARELRRLPAPRVLLGDLNLPAGPARAFSGWRTLARVPTYPSPSPRAQLDHVLADPRGGDALGRVAEVRNPQAGISDHRPLVVHLHRPG